MEAGRGGSASIFSEGGGGGAQGSDGGRRSAVREDRESLRGRWSSAGCRDLTGLWSEMREAEMEPSKASTDPVFNDASLGTSKARFARFTGGGLFDADFSRIHGRIRGSHGHELVNHGVPEDVISKLREDMEEFFKLPLEEKEKVAQLPGQIEGYGQAFVQSEEQKLDWADMLALATLPPNIKQLRFWPTNPPSFRENFEKYANEVKRVADGILKMISKNLGLGVDKLYDMFKGGIQIFRFNYYPPCPTPEKVLGLSSHSDAVGLTILLQVNELQGLEIKRNGGWLPVKVQPGTFIVNIGDMIEILCNGKYKSIEHRAIVNNEKARLSVAGFHELNIGDVVRPIPEIVKGDKLHYKSLEFEEYKKQVFSCKLEAKTILDLMKLDE